VTRPRVAHPISLGHSFDSLLFVAGSARSGTTWLQEVLDAQARFRIFFEPFHELLGPERLRGVPGYIRPDLDSAPFLPDVEDVLRGRVRDRWIDQHNRRLVSWRRMIKEIHSNLRLRWLREQFPHFPIVYMIRHPCAVTASRGRLNWRPSPERYFSNPDLVEDHLSPFQSRLAGYKADYERRVIQWCVENYVPLVQFQRRRDILVVFYERLVTDFDHELATLTSRIGIAKPEMSRDRVSRPSVTTYRAHGFETAGAVDDWRLRMAPAEIKRALEIVSIFGLDALYTDDPMPREVDPLDIY
jgi:hypothetical protein